MNSRAEDYASELINRRWLSNKSFELTLSKPNAFNFKPGQRIRLFRDTVARDYSLVSAPAERDLVLCIRYVSGGILTPGLSKAAVGSRFDFNGPHGYFRFRPSDRKPVFVATGTGVAPFVSMARSGVRGFILLHGADSTTEVYYAAEFKSAAKQYVPCISEPTESDAAYFPGRVTDYLRTSLVPGFYDFYLCGRREMIRDVTLLVDERFAGSYIFTEIFY